MIPLLPIAFQLFFPLPVSIWLPHLIWNETLESQVLNGLMLVVPSLGVLMLLIGSWIFQKSKKESNQFFILLGRGLLGWVLGGIGFHIILILFGAPFYELVAHTFLLGLLIASFSTLLGAMLFGSHLNEYLEVVLTLRCRSIHEKYVAFTTIGSTLGAYFGALPIPLDWDRPWQQWPLTCVYGCLLGNIISILIFILFYMDTSNNTNNKKKTF